MERWPEGLVSYRRLEGKGWCRECELEDADLPALPQWHHRYSELLCQFDGTP